MSIETLSYDAGTGMAIQYEWNFAEKNATIAHRQSRVVVDNCLELAKELRNDGTNKQKGIKRSWMHAAIIPNSVIEKMIKQYRVNPYSDPKSAAKILQRDFPHLKTVEGRIA